VENIPRSINKFFIFVEEKPVCCEMLTFAVHFHEVIHIILHKIAGDCTHHYNIENTKSKSLGKALLWRC